MDLGEEPHGAAFHVKVVPTSFLIDRQGRVVGRWAGKNDPEADAGHGRFGTGFAPAALDLPAFGITGGEPACSPGPSVDKPRNCMPA